MKIFVLFQSRHSPTHTPHFSTWFISSQRSQNHFLCYSLPIYCGRLPWLPLCIRKCSPVELLSFEFKMRNWLVNEVDDSFSSQTSVYFTAEINLPLTISHIWTRLFFLWLSRFLFISFFFLDSKEIILISPVFIFKNTLLCLKNILCVSGTCVKGSRDAPAFKKKSLSHTIG